MFEDPEPAAGMMDEGDGLAQSGKRARMAATIFSSASRVPSLPSRSAVRNCAHKHTSPQKQNSGR
jgi:hypothetical protein